MSTLAEIEAAADALSLEERRTLFHFLASRLRDENSSPIPSVSPDAEHDSRGTKGTHSMLDIPPMSVGKILRPLSADDDLLGEMLEGRM